MKKQFKIGECAIGGIVSVEVIPAKVVRVYFLDWNTKKIVPFSGGAVDPSRSGARRAIDECLNEGTTSYHADKILKWIESKTEFKNNY
jgi:hypothetical protein